MWGSAGSVKAGVVGLRDGYWATEARSSVSGERWLTARRVARQRVHVGRLQNPRGSEEGLIGVRVRCPTGDSRAGGGLGLSLVCGSVAWRAVPFAALMLASGWVKRLRSRSSSRRLAKKVKDRCRCVCVCVRDAWRPVRWGSVAGRRGRPRLWIVSKVTDKAGCRALPRPVVAPVRWRCLHYRWGARTNCTRRGHYGPRLLPA